MSEADEPHVVAPFDNEPLHKILARKQGEETLYIGMENRKMHRPQDDAENAELNRYIAAKDEVMGWLRAAVSLCDKASAAGDICENHDHVHLRGLLRRIEGN